MRRNSSIARLCAIVSVLIAILLTLSGCFSASQPITVVVEDGFGRVQSSETLILAPPARAARDVHDDYVVATRGGPGTIGTTATFDRVVHSAELFLRAYPGARQASLVRDLGMIAALQMSVQSDELAGLQPYEQDFVSAGYIRHALWFLDRGDSDESWRVQLSERLAEGLWLREGMEALVAALVSSSRTTRRGLQVDADAFLAEMQSSRAELATIDKWYEDLDIEGLARVLGGEEP